MTFGPKLHRRRFLQTSAAAGAVVALPALPLAAQEAAGTIKISVNITPNLLNPMLHRVSSEYLLGEMLYSGLTKLAVDMSPQPDLAESWEANEAADEWRFTLRDAKFHNGETVTAADAVASLKKVLDPETGSPGRRNLGPIASVEADGEKVVVIKTETPFADLPVSLTYTTAKIAPASIIENDFESLATTPMGSGPFKFVSFEPDRLAVVEANPDYFIAGLPKLSRVEVMTFPDAAASTAALLAGEVDMMMEVQPTDFARLDAADGIVAMRTPSGRFLDVVMDCSREPFNDPRVREALSLCVDREAMVELVAEGYGTPGNDSPINSAYRFYSGAELKKPDIEKAKQLMAEAGHGDGLDLTLVASVKPDYRSAMAVVLREMARPAGFNIDVQTMDHSTYLDQVWKKGQFYVGFYNMQPTEHAVFKLLFTSDAAWNETKWDNKEFDTLVDKAGASLDNDERAKLYAEAQALMREDVPAVIPCFFDLLGARRDYVENYEQHPRGAAFSMDKVTLGAGAPQR